MKAIHCNGNSLATINEISEQARERVELLGSLLALSSDADALVLSEILRVKASLDQIHTHLTKTLV